MRFLKTAGVIHWFAFECEACPERCELGVDADYMGRRVSCCAGCGASYIMWENPISRTPDLICVVKPVFEPTFFPSAVAYSELPEFDDDDFVEDGDADFDDEDDYDEFEEALGECGRSQDYEGCMNAGSEYCEFECPFNR